MCTSRVNISVCTCAHTTGTTDRMRSFDSQANQLHLKPGTPTTLNLTFVPLKMGARHCAVVLRNDALGEIVLSITATVQLPFPILPKLSDERESRLFLNSDSQTVHLKAHVGERVEEEVLISGENPALERALLEVCQWGMPEAELKRRLLTNSLGNAALSTAREFFGLKEKILTAADNIGDGLDKLSFSVEGTNDNFRLPESISVLASGGGAGRLPVGFVSEEPGQFECRVVLRSAHDVRVFIIESTVLERGREVQLEFTTTAMQPLTQDIPIVSPALLSVFH